MKHYSENEVREHVFSAIEELDTKGEGFQCRAAAHLMTVIANLMDRISLLEGEVRSEGDD